jgi:hypothetical protein
MGKLPKRNSNISLFVSVVTIGGRSAMEKSGQTDRRSRESLPKRRFEATANAPPANLQSW